ncbi:MAG TPA: hypothetical protein VMT12_17620 [Syntrophales bacterium]|nr:hypothetical protein [Syntrophales bacterium]
MKTFFVLLAITILIVMPSSVQARSVHVSGYTDQGVYVYGDMDVDADDSVVGYVYTQDGRKIYVEGELTSIDTVEIESDSWGGGGYELDIDAYHHL